MKKTIFILMVLLAFPDLGSSEEIPVLKEVQIEPVISFDNTQSKYNYKYKISNHKDNTGKISVFRLDVSKTEMGQVLKADGLSVDLRVNNQGEMISTTFLSEFEALASEFEKEPIPVGLKIPNPFWSTGLSIVGAVSWWSKRGKDTVKPGETLDGLILESYGIPSIRSFEVEPHWVLVVEGFVGEGDLEKSKKIEEEITFHGKTIGPTAPPAVFVALDFTSYIEDLKHQAADLGWITNKGVENSLDVKLAQAKKHIQSGNTQAATKVLNAFINEVEAQGCSSYDDCPKGKHLSPEAWALLKFNAEYLLSQL